MRMAREGWSLVAYFSAGGVMVDAYLRSTAANPARSELQAVSVITVGGLIASGDLAPGMLVANGGRRFTVAKDSMRGLQLTDAEIAYLQAAR